MRLAASSHHHLLLSPPPPTVIDHRRCRSRLLPPSAAVRRHPPLPPPLPAVIVVARRRHPRPARCCSPRPPPSHVPRSSGVRLMHPHPISRSLPSPSISILVADTLHLRPPLGGYISSLRRTSSRTLPESMLRDRRRSSLRRGMWKSALPPRWRGRLDSGGERMELAWTVEVLRPGGTGPGGVQRSAGHLAQQIQG